ncbi:MAG: hypothetical protein HY508_13565 [Acidobacteria bacterium]|nr:hypothetical protein [Acidobacteriota bacterium]
MIRTNLHHRLARTLLIVVEIATFLVLSLRIGRNFMASRAAEGVGAAELNRAIELDPGNAEYHLRLARLALYSVSNASPELAQEHLMRAAELSPRNVQVWLELSAAHGFQGDPEKAESYLRRADMMAPQIPAIQWVVGNFFLLQGNTDGAFKHFRMTLSGSHKYDSILFRTAWKSSEDGAKILDQLIPPRIDTEFGYLYYLLGEKKLSETSAVWKRIAAGPEKFDAGRVAGYLNRLFDTRKLAEATQVWNDLRNKGLISPAYQPTAQNLIINGNFEEVILNLGFDWRIAKVEGVRAGTDESTFHSPGRAMKVSFAGKANTSYWHVYQFVRVEPKQKYRLQAFLKIDGITTDSGPRLRVVDMYDPAKLTKFSESLTGTTRGWNQVILEFTTGPTTELLTVSLARLPSAKLDNMIAGTVWLDDVSLTLLP